MTFQFKDNEEQLAKVIAEVAHKLNYPTYYIGGFVRDRLLNRSSKDIDIVCVGDGITLAEEVGKGPKYSERSCDLQTVWNGHVAIWGS